MAESNADQFNDPARETAMLTQKDGEETPGNGIPRTAK